MPVLGALVKATNIVKMESLRTQIVCIFLKKIGGEKTKKNIQMVERAYIEARTDGEKG